jgi:hypothetical protein
MPQQFSHLRLQVHPALHHRFPGCQQDEFLLWRAFPDQASQDLSQDLVQVGQVVLVDTPDVPSYGELRSGRGAA